jgi:subtilisin family serine protease
MTEQVVVRLVPRLRGTAQRLAFGLDSVASATREFAPDPRKMRSALSWFGERTSAAQATELNRLEVRVDPGDIPSLFGTEVRKAVAKPRTPGAVMMQDRYFVPKERLEVPEALRDTIEFAYLPQPAEYFSPSYIAPSDPTEHLDLEDVRAAVNASRAHRQTWTGAGVRVAMVDTGFFPHPYFAAHGYKLVPTASPGSGPPEVDASGHGTGECANIFAVAPDCTVYGVKSGLSSATSLETAIALKPDVLSNSWGYNVDTQSRSELQASDPNFFNEFVDLETILSEAVTSGIVVVFAAGNGHRAFPACMPQIIAAGGVTVRPDASLEASSYASSFVSTLYPGRQVPDLCGVVGSSGQAPLKHHIMLPVPADSRLNGANCSNPAGVNGWGIFSGTSAACPQVAGAVALLRGILKGARADQARTAMVRTATDVTAGRTAMGDRASPGPDLATGAGLLNARAACEFFAGMS